MHALNRFLLALILWLFGFEALAAPTQWPGSSGICNTALLQDCINGVGEGIGIEIITNVPINEDISINRSLDLSSATGYQARFATGRSIRGSSSGADDYTVMLSGIALTNGQVNFYHGSTGLANITVQDMDIQSTSASNAAGIQLSTSTSAGSASFVVYDNHLKVAVPGSLSAAIKIEHRGNNGRSIVLFNQVEAIGEPTGWGILVDANQGGTPSAYIVNNTLRGRFGRSAIDISEGLFSESTPSTVTARVVGNVVIARNRLGGGVSHTVTNGTINTQVLNNTVVGANRSMQFVHWGIGGGGTATGSIAGPVENNLLVYGERGLLINPSLQTSIVENYNLIAGNNSNTYTPGANDVVTTDPQLLSLSNPRLKSSSPAINAGLGGRPLAIFSDPELGIGSVDADGLRRLKGGLIDIGAYEYGDVSFMARAEPRSSSQNTFPINDLRVNGVSTAHLFITGRYGPENSSTEVNPKPAGVYYGSGVWRIFNQEIAAAIPNGTSYNVFLPANGFGVLTSSAGSSPSAQLTLSDFALNRDSIVFITSNWNPSGGLGVYNNHTTAVDYASPNWIIQNNDMVPMLAGASFNVYAQDPSPNVFLHYARSGNTQGVVTRLDHPLLNGVPCAAILVTPAVGTHGDNTFGTLYEGSSGFWHIYNNSPIMPPMSISSKFHVLIDPAQVDYCNRPLMSDGFEE
jgi:hypothetical protein